MEDKRLKEDIINYIKMREGSCSEDAIQGMIDLAGHLLFMSSEDVEILVKNK